jgi:Zn-dependent protease with chaperone function
VAPRKATLRQRAFSHRPPGYPNPFVWLRSGIMRDWRGPLGALVSTWLYLPLAFLTAGYGAVVLGVGGLLVGGLGLKSQIPDQLHSLPIVGSALDSFLARSGGIFVGLLGFALGALVGFIAGLVLPWADAADDPLGRFGALIGILVSAVLLGIGYTLYRVVLERWLLHIGGARRLSRRESELVMPVLHRCAQRLGLPTVPALLIHDDPEPNAHAYTRHIVVNKGLLDEFDYDTGPVGAVIAHELVHWRNGDAVTSAFVRGIALPLYLLYAFATWLNRVFPHPIIRFLVWYTFWPILVTVKYVVMPLQAMDTRQAEFRADQGSVLTGNRAGMRRVLSRFRSFEGGRNGWEEAVCATHPPNELRLERLEAPGGRYPLPDEEPEPDTTEVFVPSTPAERDAVFAPPLSGGPRIAWIGAGAFALLCCVLLSALAIVQWNVFRPENTVSAYFSALTRHDGAAALRAVTPVAAGVRGQPPAPLPAGVLRGNGYSAPTDVKIGTVVTKKDLAAVPVSFKLNGASRSIMLTLRRDKQTTGVVFHGWHILGGVFPFQVASSGLSQVLVDGVPVDLSDPAGSGLGALPGTYTVSAPGNALSEVPPVTVTVDPAGNGFANIAPNLKPDAMNKINQLVHQYVDGCAATTVAEPPDCPFSYRTYGGTVSGLHWQILSYPTLSLQLVDPTQARVTTQTSGRVKVTGTLTYAGQTGPVSDEGTFTVSGVVLANGDNLVWQRQG